MRYWDSSAVLPLCVDEPHSHGVKELLTEDPAMIVWWGTVLECRSALARVSRESRLDQSGVEDAARILSSLAGAWTEVQPVDDVRHTAARLLRVHPLRAADALQLAAALVWSGLRPEGYDLVCLDDRLRAAARKEGFHVMPA